MSSRRWRNRGSPGCWFVRRHGCKKTRGVARAVELCALHVVATSFNRVPSGPRVLYCDRCNYRLWLRGAMPPRLNYALCTWARLRLTACPAGRASWAAIA